MQVLVTGSAGRIGRRQVQTLQEAGFKVRTFDRPERDGTHDGETATEHISGDLRDLETVRRAVQGMDAVAHLGAIPNDRRGQADQVLDVNVRGTWNLLLACVEAGVPRVVYFSSVNALGCFGGYRPLHYLPIDDDYPRHPQTPYQLSKHLGEEACRAFSNRHGLITLCLRPVYVSDPSEYRPGWRDPHAQHVVNEYWAYVDIRDVCQATVRALQAEGVLHGGFLLTADDTLADIPTGDLVARYHAETPWRGTDPEEWLAENPVRTLLDCGHAKRALGWHPAHSWRDEKSEG